MKQLDYKDKIQRAIDAVARALTIGAAQTTRTSPHAAGRRKPGNYETHRRRRRLLTKASRHRNRRKHAKGRQTSRIR